MSVDGWATAAGVLRLAAELVDGIQDGVAARGFTDVRPTHGFAFAFLGSAPATTAQLAEHLGITKQAAGEVVAHLVDRGYVTRVADPTDRRARLLVLTDRGAACTRAARAAAEETVAGWDERVTPHQAATLHRLVASLAGQGPLRPSSRPGRAAVDR